MRVVAGKFKGIKLNEFAGKDIRPTSDMAKEAIFSKLGEWIKGKRVLDLFCGTGSLGIEALSRGAGEVVFVDSAKESAALTKSNLAKIKENAKVLKTDALNFLERNDKFDLIFIDPPYADDVSLKAVDKIFENNILSDDGIVVFERDKPFEKKEGIGVFGLKRYGKAYISYLRKEKKCLFAGTFDPITIGHEAVVKAALDKYDTVYVVIMNNDKKTPMFSLDERLGMLTAALGANENIVIDSYGGMLTDYMKEKNIFVNVRGIRNDSDRDYERVMEEFNTKAYPQIIYDYIETDDPASSTEVRERLKSGEPIDGLVDKKILKYIKERYERKTDKE